MSNEPIAVLGTGSWGTALAIAIARGGRRALIWGHNPEHVGTLQAERRNARYLPDVPFPALLSVHAEIEEVSACRDFLIVVPSHAFRSTLVRLKNAAEAAGVSPDEWTVCWGTKGFEPHTGQLLDTVVQEILGDTIAAAALSGPSFAGEVALGQPTALTAAAQTEADARRVADWFRERSTRVYTSTDLTGVQLGGAIKNVMAIATGISDGLGFGANTRAALITRGLAEMIRLGSALGGRRETFMGLTGVGDLILTCTDNQSRNRRVGIGLGQGGTLKAVVEQIGQEVEGINTTRELFQKSSALAVEMPITEQVYGVLFSEASPSDAVTALLSRSVGLEAH